MDIPTNWVDPFSACSRRGVEMWIERNYPLAMNEILSVLGFLGILGMYLFICHRIAKRGHSTGLFYNRVFITAVIAPFLAAIWVYLFRTPRRLDR